MSCNYYEITNYNNVQEGYYRYTACTDSSINVNSLNPLDRVYVCAEDLIVEEYSSPLNIILNGPCPSATPTISVTPSVTPTLSLSSTPVTPTVTSTNTPTPTITPTTVYERNLRTGGWYEDVCNSVNEFANPSNVNIFTTKPFDQLKIGDHVYGNKQLTIPVINGKYTISDGAKFIQLSGTLVMNVGLC